MKVDIHLVSWNRPLMTNLVIRAIHRNTKRDNFRLMVWDNGSETSTQAILQDLRDAGLIDELYISGSNIGLEAARQKLLLRSQYGFFVCVDNDCLPPPMQDERDWVDEMIDLMRNNEIYAAISMRTQIMIGTGNIFEEADGDPELIQLVDFPHPGGSYRIMRTDLTRAVGGWGRKAEGRGAEERYICGKLRDEGYATAFATNVKSLHLFGLRDTDNWGYPKLWTPEQTGHSPNVWHPIFDAGDDFNEVSQYVGTKLAEDYFDGAFSRNT